MSKVVKVLLVFFVFISSYIGMSGGASAESFSVNEWANFDIRTQPTPSVTAEAMDKLVESKSKNGKLNGLGKAIMEAGEVNGINPAFLFAQIVFESAWGESKLSLSHNNLGGVKCSSNAKEDWECVNGYQKFPDATTFVQAHAELLSEKYITNRKLFTIKDILNVYAPSSDNNNHDDYISGLKSSMEQLGQTPTNGKLMEKSAHKNYEVNGAEVGKYGKDKSLFLETTGEYLSNIGIDTNENMLFSTEMAYRILGWSDDTYKWMTRIGVVLGCALLVYMSVTILLYVMLIKGYSNDTKWFTKLSKIDEDVYGRKALIQLYVRLFFGVLIIALCFSGLYINLMALVYTGIDKLMDFIL